jgi:hypothetical protein
MTLLGNDYRYAKIGILLAVIICLCTYSHLDNSQKSTFRECIAAPGMCPGTTIQLGGNTRIGSIGYEYYELVTPYGNITVIGDIDSSSTNRFVNVILKINHKGKFVTENIYVRPYRSIKIFVSTVPVLILFVLFIRQYRFSLKKLLFIER